MNHNGGFPPIFEGGKKEIIQREFSAQNILSINQILTAHNSKVQKRSEPMKFNTIDEKPIHHKNKK